MWAENTRSYCKIWTTAESSTHAAGKLRPFIIKLQSSLLLKQYLLQMTKICPRNTGLGRSQQKTEELPPQSLESHVPCDSSCCSPCSGAHGKANGRGQLWGPQSAQPCGDPAPASRSAAAGPRGDNRIKRAVTSSGNLSGKCVFNQIPNEPLKGSIRAVTWST